MSLKHKTISNVKWSFIESISLKAIGFVLGIILARLLLPSDFGLLAVVNVFYLLVTLFIDGGLKEALIQKKDATEVDYSSVFWTNIFVSIFLYLLLFFSAPFIEDFYGYENLAFYIRLQSLTLIIESFGVVQIAKATKELNLKKITKARIPASLVSFAVGVYLAYYGFGIISLIVQQLVNTGLYTLLLVFTVKYKPTLTFSKQSINTLYKFGIKILTVALLSRFYSQSLNLIYAKFYNPQLLGLNNKSSTLQNTPIEILNTTFMKGVYPTYIALKDDINRLKEVFQFNLDLLNLLMILCNAIFFFMAKEIIIIVLGNNWIGSVIYLKIISVGSLFYPITIQIQNIFKVTDKMNSYLKLELANKAISLFAIIIFVKLIAFPSLLIIVLGLNFLFALLYLKITTAIIDLRFFDILKNLLMKILLFGIFGALLHYCLNQIEINDVTRLLTFIFLYLLGWSLYVYRFEKRMIEMVKNLNTKI